VVILWGEASPVGRRPYIERHVAVVRRVEPAEFCSPRWVVSRSSRSSWEQSPAVVVVGLLEGPRGLRWLGMVGLCTLLAVPVAVTIAFMTI